MPYALSDKNQLPETSVKTTSPFLNKWVLLAIACAVAVLVYWPGLSGTWLFDDYPNIVDNPGVQPQHFNIPSLVRAALSSPASDFKRPLASLSFALNYLSTGLNPYWMKLTNLIIHVINGCLVFLVARRLLCTSRRSIQIDNSHYTRTANVDVIAVLIATAWMVLPINLTCVLYVVQRMESMANAFVLIGLYGYLRYRSAMFRPNTSRAQSWGLLFLCAVSIGVPVAVGALAKETAVMLPLYALLVEWTLFDFEKPIAKRDIRVFALFFIMLVLPAVIGLVWLLPNVLNPNAWATRDFTLSTRLFTEARVVVQYIHWTLLPPPNALSFYHDDVVASTGLTRPYTTLLSIIALLGLFVLAVIQRRRTPLFALGVFWFLGAQLLTATVVPLELIYEHRNYFASFGLLLAVFPLITPLSPVPATSAQPGLRVQLAGWKIQAILRYGAIIIFIAICATQTLLTATAWGDQLRLAIELAARAPKSPRAQYELGRTLIIYSNYNPSSPFTPLVYAPLERAAALPGSSILPQQALIFMNSRMGVPLKDSWWQSMIEKLKSRPPGVQDESSLSALVQCTEDGLCNLPHQPMTEAFQAAMSHPNPSARLLAMYGDYAWNVLGDHQLGEDMINKATQVKFSEPAYHITLARMAIANGDVEEANQQIDALKQLNIGGRLDESIESLQKHLPIH
jgi:protein O-mannosyl-transferase